MIYITLTPQTHEPPPCPACGFTAADVAQTGKLGCAQCYTHFRGILTPHVRKLHGAAIHNGLIPSGAGDDLARKRKKNDLEKQLAEAINAQEFETCARLRDEIIALDAQAEEVSNT